MQPYERTGSPVVSHSINSVRLLPPGTFPLSPGNPHYKTERLLLARPWGAFSTCVTLMSALVAKIPGDAVPTMGNQS